MLLSKKQQNQCLNDWSALIWLDVLETKWDVVQFCVFSLVTMINWFRCFGDSWLQHFRARGWTGHHKFRIQVACDSSDLQRTKHAAKSDKAEATLIKSFNCAGLQLSPSQRPGLSLFKSVLRMLHWFAWVKNIYQILREGERNGNDCKIADATVRLGAGQKGNKKQNLLFCSLQ